MALVGGTELLAGLGEGLAGEAGSPYRALTGPAGKVEGVGPPTDAGEEVAVVVADEVHWYNVFNRSAIDVAIGKLSLSDQFAQPRDCVAVVLVVIRHRFHQVCPLAPSMRCFRIWLAWRAQYGVPSIVAAGFVRQSTQLVLNSVRMMPSRHFVGIRPTAASALSINSSGMDTSIGVISIGVPLRGNRTPSRSREQPLDRPAEPGFRQRGPVASPVA